MCYFRVSVLSYSMSFSMVFLGRTKTLKNSPATLCSAIQNSIMKLNLNSAEIALSKPVSVFSEC